MTRIKFFLKSLFTSCLFFVASGIVSGQALAAPRLYFDPATYTSVKNTDFQVNLKIDVENKSAFGADAVITFPSTDITVKSVVNGGFFSDFSVAQTSGKIEVHGFFSSLFDAKSGSGNFATLTLSSNKDAGSGNVSIVCSGSGNDTQIIDNNGQNILDCGSINQLSLTYSGATVTPAPTATPYLNPPTNACGGTCGSIYNCNSGLFCYQGFCRNPDCRSDLTCSCKATPTPTIKPKSKTSTPKPTIKASSTPGVVTLTQYTPPPISSESASPIPEKPQKGVNLQRLALWAGLGILGLAVLFAIIGAIKGRNKPPKITPPGNTTDIPMPPPVMPQSPPFPPVAPPPATF